MMKANVSFPVNPATILQRRYIAALLLVGMLTLGTQWLIQGNLASQLADSKVINVAGRQRMLSQRLCKAAYKDLYAADSKAAQAAIAELKLVRQRWTEGHRALLEGNPKMGIPRTENAEIRVLLSQAQVFQNAMLEATAFVDAPINPNLDKARRDDLRFLLSNEPLFLDRMEKVVSAYEKVAQKRVADGRRGEIAYALVTLLLLIAEAFFVFRPATRTIRNQFDDLHSALADAEAARLQAENAERIKSEFLANTSHEIRTPLNGVIGTASVMLGQELSPRVRAQVQTIANSANGLLALLNNVLDNAKLESGKLRAVCEPFDLYEVVHSAAELYRAGCEMKGIDLDVAIDHDVERWYLGDGVRIRQIIQNLTHNALKFTERGQISVLVKSGDGISITVRDTGVGMSATDLESLFERYRQFGELDRRTTGTGLGLAISRDLVHAMGGEFTVASAEGVGSAFTMVLPLAVAEAPPEKVPTFLLIPTMSILVVEDDVVNQLVVTSMLESMGHRSQAVGTGREGVQAALSGKYQLVLMDSQLPDFDGIEATRQIRSQETGRLTIVGLTANAFRDHEIKCLEAGMDAVATKPITRESLEQSLASALQIA